jgi:Ni/Fe-hydrogenase 1 B-type cytochrome subunit
MAVGILFRLYWSFVGNYFSREIIRPPFFSRKFWRGVWLESVSYLKAEHSPRRYIGHNPLAIISMHVMFMWVVIFMIITGFALYGEGRARAGSTPSSPGRCCCWLAATASPSTLCTISACGRW